MVKLVKQNFFKNKKLYNNVKQSLTKKLKKDVPINHVGSTAIKNMYGKNIIDILIGAKSFIQFQKIANMLITEGYFESKAKDNIYQFFSSKKEETGEGDIHIHLVLSNTERYKEFLLLKEFLLNNESEAIAYSNFKKQIINNGTTERNDYKRVKSEYVTQLLERAKENIKI